MTRGDDRPGQLEVTVSFGADEVVVGVHGDVDLVTAADLGAVLASVLGRGTPVAVDLAATHFLGVAGLRVLEIGAKQLADRGRRLTIRSPSVLVARMLCITGLADMMNVESNDEGRTHLGPKQTASVPAERDGVGPDEAYTLLRRFSRETNQPLRERAADIAGSTRRYPRSVPTEQKEGPWLAS